MFSWNDVRYAGRLLARAPMFTLLTVVVLAGGLGLSIFTFSFLQTAMFEPLPLDGGARVVRLMSTTVTGSTGPVDAADLAAIRSGIATLTDIGAYRSRAVVLGGEAGGAGRSIEAVATETNLFETARARAALGRVLGAGDGEPGAEPVIVLSDRALRVALGGDSSVVGRRIEVNGVPTRVIGVMPPGFGFPVAAEAWIPIEPELLRRTEPGRDVVDVYARLAADATPRQADAELAVAMGRIRADRPVVAGEEPATTGMVVRSFPMAQIGEGGPLAATVLNALAGLILLLACVNVGNLLVARANERAREFAVRLALGASRGRLVLQHMWESILLCLFGGVFATVFAAKGLGAIDAWARFHLEGNLAFWWRWGFNRSLPLVAGGFVTLAIAGLGAAAFVRASRTDVASVLRDGGARGGGRREGRVARGLVLVQVVTVSVLMFAGAMAAMVAWRVGSIDPGYDTRNLLSASLDLPADRYADAAAAGRFYEAVADGLERRPELAGVVLRAGLASRADDQGRLEIDGPVPSTSAPPAAYVQAELGPLTPLGIELREGRFFDSGDDARGSRVALVSRSLAELYFGSGPAIGRQIRLAGLEGDTAAWRTVVGVVSDVLMGNPLSRSRSPVAVWIPLRQSSTGNVNVVFRHRGDAQAAQGAFLQTVAALDPLVIPATVSSFEEILSKTTLIARSVAELFGGSFFFALVLAVSGTYGLMARSIGRRTREIGIRLALGASDRAILRMLLAQGGRQLGAGALIALPLTSFIGTAFIRLVPIGIPLPAVLAVAVGVSCAITAVVLGATWLPTRRAARIGPATALHME